MYQPYLACLAGKSRSTLSPAGAGCPEPSGRKAEIKAITGAVRAALWTVATLFQKPAVGGTR